MITRFLCRIIRIMSATVGALAGVVYITVVLAFGLLAVLFVLAHAVFTIPSQIWNAAKGGK